MHIKALYLHNFRIYEEALFEFSPSINVVRGSNARGKTSLLEAIYFLMTGRSFRTTQPSDLIRHGAPFLYLDATFVKHGIEQKLRIHYNGKERKILYNATPCPSTLNLLGLLQGVVIHPDDATLIKGAPTARRQLLDLQLAQADPLYVHHLTRYERAMKQRNHLLRAKSPSTIESWEYEMANAAAYIIPQRSHVVADLQRQGSELYAKICGGTELLGLEYKPHGTNLPLPEVSETLRTLYCRHYHKHRRREMELGLTLTGPHKDDLSLTLDHKEARAFASEGQQRSCIAALRLAAWERLNASIQETPLMLVDDIGISLDSGRRAHLLEHFTTLGQVFVTTTETNQMAPGEHVIAM